MIERNFLGHYETLQYLEDCGILAKVLQGELCSHYRSFKGHIFYPWCRALEKIDTKVEICSTCHIEEHPELQERLVIVGNFMGGKCSRTHDLSIFFETNKIPYSKIDPYNGHLKRTSMHFLNHQCIELEPVRLPMIFINSTEYSIK